MNKNNELPYERFLRFGPSSLTDAELLAIMLRTGTKGTDALTLAHRVLSLYDPGQERLIGLRRATMPQLTEMPGIGEVKAVRVLSAAEIANRMVREKCLEAEVFTDPEMIADFYMESLRHLSYEVVLVAHLDNKCRLIGEDMISRGTANAALLSPREVYMKALERRAVQIVLIHNHPSGDPTPSQMDAEITEQVRAAGELMDIRLLDHIIIGDLCYRSFREEGRLP